MGEYFDWVNVNKREYICPGDFDYGNKFHESRHKNNPVLCALYELLSGRWKGDPVVFLGDEAKIPDMDYVRGMCEYLEKAGELYYIEVRENGEFLPVGDVTVKGENPPIAIWFSEYRGKGLGTLAMKAVIRRLKELP